MTVREIIRMGHPTLRELAEPYPLESIGSPAFDQLVEDLTDTLAASGGIGRAAHFERKIGGVTHIIKKAVVKSTAKP